jgi:hypothetical protein
VLLPSADSLANAQQFKNKIEAGIKNNLHKKIL